MLREAADPLVTVVIPTHDRLPLLRAAVASVAAQTYARWELVVADDGSTDGTAEAVWAMSDPRVRVVALAREGHIGRVRNAGVAAGSGELVAFLDSDDLWLPGKLAAQLRALRESGARWCYAGFEMMDEEERTIPMRTGEYRPPSGWIARDVVTMRTGVAVGSLLVERRLFDEVGGFSCDPRLRARGDLELAMRLALRAEAVAVPDTLVRVREHPGRFTAGLPEPFERSALAYELFLAQRPDAELARLARRRRGELLASAAAQRMARGDFRLAARQLARSLADGAGVRRVLSALRHGIRARVARPRSAS
jgi:glycosyltransferase involved in cell wall biosynthesis